LAPNSGESPGHIVIENLEQEKGQTERCGEAAIRLRRWLVSFAPGRACYPVGEFAALDATSAIDKAIEVLGAGADYQAEETPWDAAPLARLNPLPSGDAVRLGAPKAEQGEQVR
jgi:hypothetical protein